jgi:hypothetical protein
LNICPFCGCDKLEVIQNDYCSTDFWVEGECGHKGPHRETKEDAILAWEDRVEVVYYGKSIKQLDRIEEISTPCPHCGGEIGKEKLNIYKIVEIPNCPFCNGVVTTIREEELESACCAICDAYGGNGWTVNDALIRWSKRV